MERSILFSTPMVQAILDDIKSQTRRICKPQPVYDNDSGYVFIGNTMFDIHDTWDIPMYLTDTARWNKDDILWVRETFFALGKWIKNGTTKTGKQKYKFVDLTDRMQRGYMYLTSSEKPAIVETKKDGLIHWYKRPAIFMPKEACRIKLLVKSIRVERLQEITEQDAIAEGAPESLSIKDFKILKGLDWIIPSPFKCHQFGFLAIWCKINGQESWLNNPWVWVIEFEKL